MLYRGQFCRYLSLSSVSRNFHRAQKSLRPIEELLADIQAHFSGVQHVESLVKVVQGIIPALGSLGSNKFDPTTITLGLMQSAKLPDGLLMECLAHDPFGMESNKWIDGVRTYRRANPGKVIRLVYEDDESKSGTHKDVNGIEQFRVRSPFLNRALRLEQKTKAQTFAPRSLFNDLNIVDSVVASSLDQCHVLIGLNLDEVQKKEVSGSIGSESCIFVRSRNSSDGIDLQKDELPVNMAKLQAANEAIGKSVDNVSKYVKLFEESNAKALFKKVNERTAGYRPLLSLLRSLHSAILNTQSTATFLTDVQIDGLKRGISIWARESHRELQDNIGPYLDTVLVKDFTKVSRILWNGDNLHNVMADSLAIDEVIPRKYPSVMANDRSLHLGYHGSLKNCEKQLSGLKRDICSVSLGEPNLDSKDSSKVKACFGKDPMVELQEDVVSKKLPELQSVLNGVILRQNIEITLPVFCVTMVGYVTNVCDLNTGVAIFTFSAAIVALRTSKKVYKEVHRFAKWYYERIRRAIDSNLVYLNGMLNRNYESYKQEQQAKADLDEELKEKIKEVEKTEISLETNTEKR